jgi:DNA-binding CsgD family transcriptional regulator
MRRLLGGETYKQIAAAMGIKPGGVRVVANKIYRVYGVRSRGELRISMGMDRSCADHF